MPLAYEVSGGNAVMKCECAPGDGLPPSETFGSSEKKYLCISVLCVTCSAEYAQSKHFLLLLCKTMVVPAVTSMKIVIG